MSTTISIEKFRAGMAAGSPLHTLDVRSAAEFATGHLPGAVNISMEQVESRIADVPQGLVVLVCESGKRAEIVAGWLADRREVALLEGGTRAWRNSGYPLVTCAPCRWTLERQVRLIAGLLVLIGAVLAVLVNTRWLYLPMLIGAGLTFAGLTNICGMAVVLARMPWNSERKAGLQPRQSPGANCST